MAVSSTGDDQASNPLSPRPGAGGPGRMTRRQVTVLDWGIGGVGLLQQLHLARPELAIRYRSDSGFRPWGTVPTRELTRRLETIVSQERAVGTTAVLVACNAASTVLRHMRGSTGGTFGSTQNARSHGIHGVIAPGVAEVLRRGWRRVGVVGGARTIRSGAWARPIRARGVKVVQRVAQPLSARIEAGDVDGPETRALVRQLCEPLRGCDAVILACTHYPAAMAAFVSALPGVDLYDPAGAALQKLLDGLAEAGRSERSPEGSLQEVKAMSGAAHASVLPRDLAARLVAVTSGDPAATAAAALRVFGVRLGQVRRADVRTRAAVNTLCGGA